MKISYLVNGARKTARSSNADLQISSKVKEGRFTVSVKALRAMTLQKGEETYPFHVNFEDVYFLNGYQSWTDSKEYKLVKRLRNIKKSPHIITKQFAMDKYGDSSFYRYSIRKSHGYDFFYSRGKYEVFIYNLNFRTAYLIIELVKDSRDIHLTSDVKGIELAPGEELTVFDYRVVPDFQDGLASFRRDFEEKDIQKIFGYSSWYNYYQDINEEIIHKDLEALDSRFNVFQIDDGYETFVGDWLDVDPNKFPNGLKGIVDRIHEKGYKAGIWMAPYVAEAKSKLFREHIDWIRKDKWGRPIKAGGNWSGFYSLDLDNPEAMDYVEKCLRHYADMGFDFFKLDFLYASALPVYEKKSRCMVQYEAYRRLREILAGKLILGCGANIINSYGNFDYLRVGPDVSLSFDDSVAMRLFHRERISTKVTLQNTIFRSFFDRRLFGNDPDVFLLRDENIQLSKEQRTALTTINALFGSVLMTSDNISTYDKEKKAILDRALDLFENGKVEEYSIRGNIITVDYSLREEQHRFTYNTDKGVMTNER